MVLMIEAKVGCKCASRFEKKRLAANLLARSREWYTAWYSKDPLRDTSNRGPNYEIHSFRGDATLTCMTVNSNMQKALAYENVLLTCACP